MNYEFKVKKGIFVFVLFFIFIGINQFVFAVENSKVYFFGPNFTVAPESEVSISVFLDTKDPINAFDLEIIYPQDKLKFLNFDNTNSVVDIWQPLPIVLPNGNIQLSGGIIKAFTGNSGLLIQLSFKTLNPGESPISFIKSNLYIADGKGTEVKAQQETFSIYVKDGGEVIFSPIIPFQKTKSDILIEQDLKIFQSGVFWKRIFTPLFIFVIFLFVILIRVVYNKRKRTQ